MPGDRIELEGLQNTRDLGGYETASGRKIKDKRIIRSGALASATEADLRILVEQYNLKKIVDFRTRTERREKPDPVIEGVEYIADPILEEAAMGITHEREREPADLVEAMARMCREVGDEAENYLASLYPMLVTREYSIERYKDFFDLLLDNTEGALLYHCSEGKDRVGTATALLLSALGVERDEIMRDYLLTGRFTEKKRQETLRLIRERYPQEEQIHSRFLLLNGVDESYLRSVFDTVEREYGSMRSFLTDRMGLDARRLKRLEDMYLQ